jgi:hypothetical protein
MDTDLQENDSLIAAFGRIFGLTFKREIQMKKKKTNTKTEVFTFRLTKKQMLEVNRRAREIKKTRGFVMRSVVDNWIYERPTETNKKQ